jgi:hypothetical protein
MFTVPVRYGKTKNLQLQTFPTDDSATTMQCSQRHSNHVVSGKERTGFRRKKTLYKF